MWMYFQYLLKSVVNEALGVKYKVKKTGSIINIKVLKFYAGIQALFNWSFESIIFFLQHSWAKISYLENSAILLRLFSFSQATLYKTIIGTNIPELKFLLYWL